MARRIADVVAALDVAVGPDPSDLRSLPRPEASWPATLNDPKVPSRVAWSPTLGYAPLDDEVRAICARAVEVLVSLGADVTEVPEVFDEDPVGDWLTLVSSYCVRTLSPFRDTEAWQKVDPLLAALADHAAAQTSAADLVRATDACHMLNLRLVELFHDVRILVTPTCAAAPPPRSLEGAGLINGVEEANWVRFTYPFNMTRSPAATVCVGMTSKGLPVGLQLVGPQHADLVVLRTAAVLEAGNWFPRGSGYRCGLGRAHPISVRPTSGSLQFAQGRGTRRVEEATSALCPRRRPCARRMTAQDRRRAGQGGRTGPPPRVRPAIPQDPRAGPSPGPASNELPDPSGQGPGRCPSTLPSEGSSDRLHVETLSRPICTLPTVAIVDNAPAARITIPAQ